MRLVSRPSSGLRDLVLGGASSPLTGLSAAELRVFPAGSEADEAHGITKRRPSCHDVHMYRIVHTQSRRLVLVNVASMHILFFIQKYDIPV